MPKFSSKLILEALDTTEARRWELREPLVWKESNQEIRVPSGFRTDLASTPRLFWWIFPPFGLYGKAAVLHDWLYYEAILPRATADGIFLEAMIELEVEGWRRGLMYRVVRIFGWISYGSEKTRSLV
jgi:hypothetical protein